MTISEKVAYLKGLAEGLDLDTAKSKEGKLISVTVSYTHLQVGPAPHPVGNVGHWEAEAQGGPALVGRRGEKKLHAGLHILGTPLSKF